MSSRTFAAFPLFVVLVNFLLCFPSHLGGRIDLVPSSPSEGRGCSEGPGLSPVGNSSLYYITT